MTGIDHLVTALNSTAPAYLYFTLFFFAFLENLFPPAPSDLVIVFGGSLVGLGKLGLMPTILFSTLGSAAGFTVMYYVGFFLGKEIVDSGKIKFIPLDKIRQVEGWFTKYGYALVVANRFLSGTRAVISFFVGITELPILITFPLCALSALLWNSILVFGGSMLGHNWRQIERYLSIYGSAVAVLVVVVLVFLALRYFYKKKRA